MERMRKLVLHHSAYNTHAEDDPYYIWEEIDCWHRERGWTSNGYHFVANSFGYYVASHTRLSPFKDGAHCFGYNQHYGLCVAGDWRQPSSFGHSVVNIIHMINRICYWYDISEILLHRDLDSTECPGMLPELMRDVGFCHSWLEPALVNFLDK